MTTTNPDAPGYLIPCPLGSRIGLPGIADQIARPSLSLGRRAIRFHPCTDPNPAMCPLCGGFRAYFGDPNEAAAAWADYLAAISWKSPQWDTLRAMEPMGLLPKNFAERLNRKETA